MSTKPMDKRLIDAIGGPPSTVDLDKLAIAAWLRFGEAEGVAEKLFEEYEASDTGSNTRRQILETVLKLFIQANMAGSENDLLTEADIRAQAERLLDEAIDQP